MAFSRRVLELALLVTAISSLVSAHDHDEDEIPEGEHTSADPIVSFRRAASGLGTGTD
jgi:hypothetical protein